MTKISPLISHCQIKVCYVGQQPNRNHTVITKEVATEMGRNLPGSPIVGYYNQDTKDFEAHEREVEIKDGKWSIIDVTRPYGFVPTNAQVWFQKFSDEGIEREYLVTEGYLWTEAYPDSKRIIEQGNNQSMEINSKTQKGTWAENINLGSRFFIYSEALIEKLCILGENVEPCFEGAQIKSEFSLQDFKAEMYSMVQELQEALSKGGTEYKMEQINTTAAINIVESSESLANTIDTDSYAKAEDDKKPEDKKNSEPEEKEEDPKSEPAEDEKEKKNETKHECKDEKKYNLDEVTEYAELKEKFDALTSEYAQLEATVSALQAEISPLKEFKLAKEHDDKQNMINSFYMLSDEDKADVQANIDNYSLDDIEAKLSIACVRNRVNFSQEEEEKPGVTFSLSEVEQDSAIPAWIQAVKDTESKMN